MVSAPSMRGDVGEVYRCRTTETRLKSEVLVDSSNDRDPARLESGVEQRLARGGAEVLRALARLAPAGRAPQCRPGRAGHAWYGPLLIAACVAAGCGSRVPHVAPDESRPHITWEIRTGGDQGTAEFVCGSSQPSRPCVLAASSAERRGLVTVRVYLHAAREQTSYLGIMQVPFIQGSGPLKDREVSATVPPGSQPVGATVSGLVASTGQYTFRISLDAKVAGTEATQRIAEEASVQVK
jgi:hypothetical protein